MRTFFSALLVIFAATCFAQTCDRDFVQSCSFKYLSVNNGLSQNSITSVIQDSKGFIWIGTYDGLNRFDGFSILTKRHISNDQNSLSDNRILALCEAPDGNILIGTEGGGLNTFNPELNTIERTDIKSGEFGSNVIQAITTDKHHTVWAGSDKGLALLTRHGDKISINYPENLKNKNIKTFLNDAAGNILIGTSAGLFICRLSENNNLNAVNLVRIAGINAVTVLFRDKDGIIWAGSTDGLYKMDNREKALAKTGSELSSLKNITGIAQDADANLWVSTQTSGLLKLTVGINGLIRSHDQYTANKPFCNLAEDWVNSVFIDKSNTLWAGTFQNGINYTDLSAKNFYTFFPLMKDQPGVFGYKGKYISSVIETPADIWIGTLKEGLYQYNKCSKKLIGYPVVNSKSVCAIYQARNKVIWIGGNDGLYKLVRSNNGYSVKVIKENFVARSICEDNYGRLWIATWGGVLKYDPVANQFIAVTTKDGLSSNSVYVVYKDPFAQVIWAGTIGGGLNSITYENGSNKVAVYMHHENNRNSLSSNHIWCLYRDNSRTLWVGTDAGLNKLILDRTANIISYQAIQTPILKDRKIMAILEDDKRNLWLSSSQGLFKLNIPSNVVKKYTYQDGLQSNTLTEACFKSDDGLMYFGGINGLNYFKPNDIINNPFNAITALTDFKVFNKSVGIGEKIDGNVILTKDINYSPNIVLSYKQKDFMIAFASLHYATPEENKFKYKLDGYDKNWNITDFNQRIASYSNLNPGIYTFRVSSSNNDEIFKGRIKSIQIVVLPAPWATWWAKLIYAFAIIGALAWIVNYFRTKHRLRDELFNEKLEKEKVTELNEIKLNFFTTITHEIRTPLNLIMSPLQDLLNVVNTYDHFTGMRLKIIHRNSFKLYALINQILDLRKISSGNEKLVIGAANLVQVVLDVKASFNWLAEQKNIRFDYRSPSEIDAWFDKDKIEKVIVNLIANAFKYTPEGGIISIILTTTGSYNEKTARITVNDTGTGIPVDELDKIFEMYYQGKSAYSQGTGIGLALSKKLIEMHGGTIGVESLVNKGSAFRISFPISKNSFQIENVLDSQEVTEMVYTEPIAEPIVKNKNADIDLSKKSILIIEDNEDQLVYIRECLASQFHLLSACNGAEGVECAIKYQPDMVITDLMMPVCDGMEVCRRIKENVKTSHIPVIIHSVKNTPQSVKDALLAGADDFIAKPFDYSMLVLKANNILNSKNQLILNIHKKEITKPTDVDIPSPDKELLRKIMAIVEKNMAKVNFGVEKLCEDIGMSRMNLHRRLHAIIGKTASEFIREIRIKRAGQLLETGSKRISEVMFEIGISSNAHFNKYFKDMYLQSPKEYIKRAGQKL
jgi:signal transduction histidine kinase/ligand-binding sensor domain-containing protein/AraC-like DNA-binding protein